MLKNYLKYITLIFVSLTLISCSEDKPTIKVGSKQFTESEILADMIAQLAENEGIAVERKIRFGNTNTVLEALKQGILDVYPEYNGTSLTFLGQAPSSDGAKTTEIVNKLFEPSGLQLAGHLGFSNDYVMAMTQERAQELVVTKISDLASLDDPIVYSIDSDFLERPADGLQQMNRHYGISNSTNIAFPLTSEGKDQQVSALLEGKADVAELYSTDGQIAEYGLVILEDDQSFFPVYHAMPLVRTEALTNVPGFADVLKKLEGIITDDDMQAMNKAVDLDAQTPASVATNFLVSKGLLPEDAGSDGADKMLVAADPGIGSSSTTAKAIKAVRAGFEGRDLELSNTATPLAALASGDARVAMVGTESFYSLGDDGPVAKGTAEAFAVLGYKTAHLLGLRNGPDSITGMSKISTGVQGTGSAIVLEMILNSLGSGVEIVNSDASVADQVAAMTNGDVDGVFVMAVQGDREVSKILSDDTSVSLISLDEWAEGGHAAKFSFIRPATIPAEAYPSQFSKVASISTQYVLAGPVERIQDAGEVGPGTAGTGESGVAPISADSVTAIREALGVAEVIDPAVPKHASLVPSIEVVDKSLPFDIHVSVVNILMVVFSVWIIYLVFLPTPRRFTLPDDDE